MAKPVDRRLVTRIPGLRLTITARMQLSVTYVWLGLGEKEYGRLV